jgi:polysaccharide export outer membrane protein
MGRAFIAIVSLSCLLAGGCKGFLDPSEITRGYMRDRLVVPILSSIDPIDEGEAEFQGASDVQPEDLKVVTTDYVIGANDLVSVSVFDLINPGVESVRTARVSETGMLSLPLLSEPVRAAGLTESRLQRAIAEAYGRAGIITNAQVSVTVVEARGRTFRITGAIARPGQYAVVEADFRIFDALIQAGDITFPSEYLYVIRKRSSEQPSTQPSQQPNGQMGPAAEPMPGPGDLAPRPTTGPVDLTPPLPPLLPPTQPPIPEPNPGTSPFQLDPKPATPPQPGAPQSAANAKRPVLAMVQDAEKKPETPIPAPTERPEDQQRIITIDGKEVIIGAETQPAMTQPAGTEPTTQPTTDATTQPGFEFGSSLEPDADTRVIRVPLSQLKSGDLRYNIVIRAGDTLIVPLPVQGEYYMGGHVGAPGVYSLTGRKITLKQAVISARMLDGLAIPQRTDVIRRIPGDKEVFIRVNLEKISDGRQPDIYLKPNDVVMVGTDFYAPFLAAIRGSFRFTYGFGFIYDRNFAPQQPRDEGDEFGTGLPPG